jgi:hypothetical protein
VPARGWIALNLRDTGAAVDIYPPGRENRPDLARASEPAVNPPTEAIAVVAYASEDADFVDQLADALGTDDRLRIRS